MMESPACVSLGTLKKLRTVHSLKVSRTGMKIEKSISTKEFLDHPVFITGHATSGTTLLRNLLDSHPELLVFPVESNFRGFINPDGSFRADFDIEKLFSTGPTTGIYSLRHGKVDLPSGKRDYSDLDFESFKSEVIKTWDNKTAKDLLIILIESFCNNSHYSGSTPKMWVEKTHGSEICLELFLKWYPNAKAIHMVRDPFDNLASYRVKSAKSGGIVTPLSFCVQWFSSLRMVLNLQQKEPDRILLVRFEDLLHNPDKIIGQVCEFLGISFFPILRVPTTYGIGWSGNSQAGTRFESISTRPIGSHKSKLSDNEIALLNFSLCRYDNFFYWDYTPSSILSLKRLSPKEMLVLLALRTNTYNALRWAYRKMKRFFGIK